MVCLVLSGLVWSGLPGLSGLSGLFGLVWSVWSGLSCLPGLVWSGLFGLSGLVGLVCLVWSGLVCLVCLVLVISAFVQMFALCRVCVACLRGSWQHLLLQPLASTTLPHLTRFPFIAKTGFFGCQKT